MRDISSSPSSLLRLFHSTSRPAYLKIPEVVAWLNFFKLFCNVFRIMTWGGKYSSTCCKICIWWPKTIWNGQNPLWNTFFVGLYVKIYVYNTQASIITCGLRFEPLSVKAKSWELFVCVNCGMNYIWMTIKIPQECPIEHTVEQCCAFKYSVSYIFSILSWLVLQKCFMVALKVVFVVTLLLVCLYCDFFFRLNFWIV